MTGFEQSKVEGLLNFLAVTQTKKGSFVPAIDHLEKALQKDLSISVFKLSEWRAMAKKGDAFYKRVIDSHILLHGSGLK